MTVPQRPLVWLESDDQPLPDSSYALPADAEAPGLLAVGGRLSPKRLEEAYRRGAFPWYSQGQPVLWWTPDPRMVLPVDQFRLHRSLRKTLQKFVRDPACEVRIDSAFDLVIRACAGLPREGQSGTWIVPEMIEAYRRWHRAGRVHSVETWIGGELVGGLYGVGIGRMFFGESMFSRRTDASKIALAALVAFCRAQRIPLIDCQQNTRHLASLGAREVSREAFETHLARVVPESDVDDWTYHRSHWALLGLHDGPADDRATPHTPP